MSKRLAVVLFNLGGPDSPDAIRPFLFNLFNDPAIIGAPGPIRWMIAKLISTRRAPVARGLYAHLGGRSPLLDLTREQAAALEARLGGDCRVFVAMRYWHPMTDEVVAAVKAWGCDELILLPLYPQYSTTTSASSIAAWKKAAAKAGLSVPTRTICCYPTDRGWITASAEKLVEGLARAKGPTRILFSAHGLPKKIIDAGDPYQAQIEMTARAIVERAGPEVMGRAGLDWRVCYQSKVGPLEWIGPSTDAEIEAAGRQGLTVIVQPVAFVSEHSETLVELDIEYAELAHKAGVAGYIRIPTVATHPAFIEGLAGLVERTRGSPDSLCSGDGRRICGDGRAGCPIP